MISSEQTKTSINDQPAIVSALTKALCYINRILPAANSTDGEVSNNPEKVEPRILIVNATPSPGSSSEETESQGGEMRGGYVGLMNCVFAAQKAVSTPNRPDGSCQKVPIDVLTLPPASGGSNAPIFLQQAAHLTDGVYWRWNGRGGLLQYLYVSIRYHNHLTNRASSSLPFLYAISHSLCPLKMP